MKVCVIGLGYIGLPTALMLAAHGVETTGVDTNTDLVNTLRKGEVTFKEDGLPELFKDAMAHDIIFSNTCSASDFYIIAVPTPYDKFSKRIDPGYVIKAVQDVLAYCEKGAIITIESTVSPGTIDRFVRPEIKKLGFTLGKDIHLAHAPERIIPGNMVYELLHNSRTIGADDADIANRVKSVYATFCQGDIVTTNIRTAEMTKVVENTFRDINIAYANELAKICRQDNMDVYEIIRIANMHPRVNILSPGPGVGGHCISVDPWFLVGDYPSLATLVRHARLINDAMPEHVLTRIASIMKEHDIHNPSRVGLYGLTYKEDVDDTRESPTLQLLECMEQHLAYGVKIFDPMVANGTVPGQCNTFEEFLQEVDIVVIMIAHSHLKQNLACLGNKIVLDTRCVLGLEGTYTL